MNDKLTHSAGSDAEQLRALGYVSNFDRTMSKWENFSLGFTYLSPVVGVYTIFASAFVARRPADVVDVHRGRPRPAPGVPDLRRNRLAVPDLRRPVSLGAPADGQALGVDGRMGLWLGAVLHHGRGRDRRRAVPRAAVRSGRQHARRRPQSSRWCSSP